jgi:hypothetical protein
MVEIKQFARNLYYPQKKEGFNTIVMIDNTFMHYPYSDNRTDAIKEGVLKAKEYQRERRKGIRVYVYDYSTGNLEEIDFTTFY